jgi:glutathione synthase/RimK-type ligase-like ATP-grasp enzyme
MSKSIHDEIAERIAKKLGTEYKTHKGIDIVKDKVIEVETKKNSLSQGIQQVIRSQKPRYLAVNKPNVKNALEATKGTGVGVMGPTGRIIKRASRKG